MEITLNGHRIYFYSEIEKQRHREENIWITQVQYNILKGIIDNTLLYNGLVSEVPEELAEKIVDKHQYNQIDRFGNLLVMYKDYGFEKVNNEELFDIDFAKQSFQTLSDLPYCIINKID